MKGEVFVFIWLLASKYCEEYEFKFTHKVLKFDILLNNVLRKINLKVAIFLDEI